MINYNENEAGNEKINHKDTTQIDLTLRLSWKKALLTKKACISANLVATFLSKLRKQEFNLYDCDLSISIKNYRNQKYIGQKYFESKEGKEKNLNP